MDRAELPGADIVAKGRQDLARGIESVEALLVSIAAPRLRTLGLAVSGEHADAELKLYRKLREAHGDAAHGRYNALLRRLVSFQRALACAR